jgi:hypothetical protein
MKSNAPVKGRKLDRDELVTGIGWPQWISGARDNSKMMHLRYDEVFGRWFLTKPDGTTVMGLLEEIIPDIKAMNKEGVSYIEHADEATRNEYITGLSALASKEGSPLKD